VSALLASAFLLPGPARAADPGRPGPGGPAAPPAAAQRPAQDAAAATPGPGPTGEKLDNATARVAAQLRCPVCRGQSVLESTSTLSKEMQAEIRRRLAAGQSPEEVKSYFVSRYGEWILLKPPAHGFNLLVYLFPAAVLVLGLGVAVLFVRSRLRGSGADGDGSAEEGGRGGAEGVGSGTPPAPDDGSPPGDLSAEERAWLERTLRERQDAGTS